MNHLSRTDKALIILIIIYPLLFIWQGLDFTDTGYCLTSYQQIFDTPESIKATFLIWLSNLIGGIWWLLFGSLGYIGFKLANVLVIEAIIFAVYLMLKNLFDRTHLLFALFLSSVFIIKSSVNWLSYQTLSGLFFVLAGVFIYLGIIKNSKLLIFIAAFIAGFNTFVRLPNLLDCVLIVSIFYYGWLVKEPVKSLITKGLIFISGYFGGIISIIFLMQIMGQLNLYLNNFNEFLNMLKDPDFHYSSSALISIILKDTFISLILALTALIGTYIIQKAIHKIKSKNIQMIILITFSIVVSIILYSYRWISISIFFFIGIIFIFVLFILTSLIKTDKEVKLIILIGLLPMLLSSLGSTSGLINAIYGAWIVLPLIILIILNLQKFKLSCFELNSEEIAIGRNIFFITLLVFSLAQTLTYTYMDSDNRFAMTHSINHPLLKGVFTTKERATVVMELLNALKKYIRKGDFILIDDGLCTVYFLTQTKPYLSNPGAHLYPPVIFDQKLQQAKQQISILPLIITSNEIISNPNWPTPPNNKSYKIPTYRLINSQRLKMFIKENNYRLVWQNSFFEIWKI